MAKTFEGKTVLVTGGSRGLGAAIARAFAGTSPTTALNQHHFTAPTERTPSRGSGTTEPAGIGG